MRRFGWSNGSPVEEGAELNDADDNKVGVKIRGTAGSNAGKPVSVAYVRADLSAIGTELFADVRGKKLRRQSRKCHLYSQRYALKENLILFFQTKPLFFRGFLF